MESDRSIVITDVSPPRGADPALLDPITVMQPDAFVVAYAPGRAVRAAPVSVAAALTERTGIPAIPTIATRDLNALAFSNLLVGMAMRGMPAALVLGGDPFGPRDAGRVAAVGQVKPSDGIRIAADLKTGKDFRGSSIQSPIALNVGAAVDLNRGVEQEAALTFKKVSAGADFLIFQPVYDPATLVAFRRRYRELGGPQLPPCFIGIEIPIVGGVTFASQPAWMQSALETGRSGADIALDLARQHREAGDRLLYVVPPIMKGGMRDYAAAVPVIDTIKSGR